MLNQFKLEQYNSTTSQLPKEAAQEFDSIYGKTKLKLEEINSNWEKFIQLSIQTTNGCGEEELNKQIDRQIDEMRKTQLKLGNLEISLEIRKNFKHKKAHEHPAIFKLNLDIRPAPLISNCTLTEVHKFINQFTRYIESGKIR